MSRSYYIYIIECVVNSKMYVGLTCNPKQRWKEHINCAKNEAKCRTPLYKSIKKYGVENFTFTPIENYGTLEEVNCAEIYWIEHLKTTGLKLFNLTNGGGATNGSRNGCTKNLKWSEKRKQKMSERSKGKKNYFYGKQLFGAANGNYGKKMKPHVQEELLKHRTKISDEQVEIIKSKFATGNFTQTKLAKDFGISITQIHRIVHGKRRKGSDNDNTLLTKPNLKLKDAIEIRRLFASGECTKKQIAERFKISYSHTHQIIIGKVLKYNI